MASATWTVKGMLDWCEGYLADKGDESPRVSAQIILSHITGMSRIELFMNFTNELTAEQLEALRPLIKRRGAGEPLQYILGTAPFRYLDIKVRPEVLIPRPETEVLVSEVLAALPAAERRIAADSRVNEYDGAAMIEAQRATASQYETNDAALHLGTTETSASTPGEALPFPAVSSVMTNNDAPLASNLDLLDEEFPEEDPVEQPGESIVFGGSAFLDEAESESQNTNDSYIEQPALSESSSNTFEGLLVADICTGSGCIACSMAYERPDIRVLATDLSPEAVALARENAMDTGVANRVGVLQGDLGEPIEAARPAFMGNFDAVISNPPYIPSSVLAELPHEVVDHEPKLALDGGEDGLDLFRRLTPWALRALKPGGIYACELHETCLEDAAAIASKEGFASTHIVNDLAGRPRVLICRS